MATKTAVMTDQSGFRQMIDSITDHEVIRLDPEGRVCSWHIGAERLTGYLADEILGRSLAVFDSPQDVTAGQPERELEAAMRDGQSETEGWRVRKDGTRFWASVVLSPIRDQNGRLERYVKIARDLTDRREQEQILQRQREAILELSTPVIQVWDKILVLPIIGVLVAPSSALLRAAARAAVLHATGTTSGVAARAAGPEARTAAMSAVIVAVQEVISCFCPHIRLLLV